ncbi:galacturonokinase isoform X2 [Dendrobium catenatum]|uniref:Galacturonokinase n=1 Tax=Dendrobium catenatum TaxID=906689 RepID=A0A2I0VF44_9ASPA|nr:galacturonokinase isoform X2 [Dendrobium catenatum]PKU62030.1 Galacturonokinase [Dendrobium catenatum]
MGASSWPSAAELSDAKKKVAEMSGRDVADVRVVISPYRICPLGAHIDHQGGTVLAMTVNKGIILAFVPSCDRQVVLRSGQFAGDVKFRVDEEQLPRSSMPVKEKDSSWGCYARGALYALQKTGKKLNEGIIGFISGSDGLDSSGLSSSAAVGIAYLMALESANNLCVSPSENIELDKLIENAYLGLRNGILDQSAILLSKYGYLTLMDCKTKEHTFVSSSMLNGAKSSERANKYKILLAFSGAKHCLKDNPGYNCRVAECQKAAKILLCASGAESVDPRLCEVGPSIYEAYKHKLKENLAKRAEHYFSENKRVHEGVKAWASGNLVEFGKLISASGLSSIQNYECGCEPMIQLYEILLRTPGVFGARFSGAGFRGCCLAFVDANQAEAATAFVQREYSKTQPELALQVPGGRVALLCEAGDSARVI